MHRHGTSLVLSTPPRNFFCLSSVTWVLVLAPKEFNGPVYSCEHHIQLCRIAGVSVTLLDNVKTKTQKMNDRLSFLIQHESRNKILNRFPVFKNTWETAHNFSHSFLCSSSGLCKSQCSCSVTPRKQLCSLTISCFCSLSFLQVVQNANKETTEKIYLGIFPQFLSFAAYT